MKTKCRVASFLMQARCFLGLGALMLVACSATEGSEPMRENQGVTDVRVKELLGNSATAAALDGWTRVAHRSLTAIVERTRSGAARWWLSTTRRRESEQRTKPGVDLGEPGIERPTHATGVGRARRLEALKTVQARAAAKEGLSCTH